MATLKINVDANCLRMDPDTSQLRIKMYKPRNAAAYTKDGLYAPSYKGDPGEGGEGYPDGRSESITIGYVSPYEVSKVPHRVNAHLVTHRTFTCTKANGSDINTRGLVTGESDTGDYVLPGDFYRVENGENFDYYIVLSTNGGLEGKGNTTVKESAFLVSVPKSAGLNKYDTVIVPD